MIDLVAQHYNIKNEILSINEIVCDKYHLSRRSILVLFKLSIIVSFHYLRWISNLNKSLALNERICNIKRVIRDSFMAICLSTVIFNKTLLLRASAIVNARWLFIKACRSDYDLWLKLIIFIALAFFGRPIK